jgi:GxxExxY protein
MFRSSAGYDELTDLIIGCGIKVHEHFGPGLFESVYSQCLVIELWEAGLQVEVAPRIPLFYRGIELRSVFQPDLVIEEIAVVEVKAVEVLPRVYSAQLLTYLKLTGCPVGLLMNFNVSYLKEGIRRLERPDLYQRRSVEVPPGAEQ